MPDSSEKRPIPYKVQADRLFNTIGESLGEAHKQQIIPFLGAGVSISERTFGSPNVKETAYPDRQKIEEILECMTLPDQENSGLTGQAKVFMELAILLGYHLQAAQADLQKEIKEDLLSQLHDEIYPPSAGELAQLFSNLAEYSGFRFVVKRMRERLPVNRLSATDEEQIEMFRYLTKATGIADPPDPLTSITSYFLKNEDRKTLWGYLRRVISEKSKPTQTHRLLARAAKCHLKRESETEQGAEDYLIITTNFDSLMEQALEEADVPYASLITENKDHKVIVRFSPRMSDAKALEEKYSNKEVPRSFALEETQRMVLLLKLHGGVNQQLNISEDGVVISDDDYVSYVSQMNSSDGVIPANLIPKMQNKPFLFLGYSLNDWNVRSIFETFKKKRNERLQIRDFAVMRSVRDFERVFFEKNNVQIFEIDLKTFIEGLLPFIPKEC